MKFKYSVKTNIGLVRSINQDYYGVQPEKGIFIIADGMGGHLAGEFASRIAVEEIITHLTENLICESDEDAVFRAIEDSINSANIKLLKEGDADSSKTGMGTTVVAAVLCKGKLYAGWAGDSRAYIYRNGHIGQITRDHSYVQVLIDSGKITELESFSHPHRAVITRAVGISVELESDLVKALIKPDDIIIICTDGITTGITADEMAEYFSGGDDPEKIADVLILKALSRGGSDNSTAIVIRIEEV
jgi:serine/threonine protein phosphatase PrpC